MPVIFVLLAIRQNLPAPVGNRLLIATGVRFIAYLIHAPYMDMYVYHNFISPDWFDAVVTLEKHNIEAQNIPTAQIQLKIEQMKENINFTCWV
ncbi:hypothetical protein [Thermoflexibacter ruber]|uniref:Uncharacterized protein n=1 Tax=Thermoflexibacter ruber TaxID=1003 RepID=A0A1I2CA67_9BACT|nr:hypothetical protein [Thermoflexibacter ruber]SFE65072.1 hypothetical protein SAMN04488541_1004163 [Thermoflexibacter ruber]